MVDDPEDGWFAIRLHYRNQIKELTKQVRSLPKRDPRKNTIYASIKMVQEKLANLPDAHADILPGGYGGW